MSWDKQIAMKDNLCHMKKKEGGDFPQDLAPLTFVWWSHGQNVLVKFPFLHNVLDFYWV